MRGVLAVAAACMAVQAVQAGDFGDAYLRGSQAYDPSPAFQANATFDDQPAPPVSAFTAELGARYWYSSSRFAKDLYDDPRFSTNLNSRLTYGGLKSHAGEIYGAFSHANGAYVSGYVGGGPIANGTLIDEDFPSGISPYSSTTSNQRGGALGYFNIDLGYNVFSGPRYKLGAFIGYHYLNEEAEAFGCTQTATSPICATAIPSDIRVITEAGYWQSFRLGVSGEVTIFERLKLAGNAAWLPYTSLKTFDSHWLRIGTSFGDFSGPVPQDVHGSGVQLEAIASYRFTDRFSLGVGGRYWKLEGKGKAELEQTIVGWPSTLAVAQPLTFKTERYGVFVQGAYQFGSL